MTRRLSAGATIIAAMLALAAPAAHAASQPEIQASWVTNVSPTSANLRASINPGELVTGYHFEYTTEADYLQNGFDNATKVPAGPEATINGVNFSVAVVQHPSALEESTSFRFILVATNSEGTVEGPVRSFRTDQSGETFSLPDNRAWEMVSPAEKNGGEIQGFGGNFGGGVLQAASGGDEITYTSTSSFGNAPGSPGASQYVSKRAASAWLTENVTQPMISGSYPEEPTSGVPFQLFSEDLGIGLVSNGRRCRTSASSACPVENPPLPGSEAPEGFRNYYLRNAGGGYQGVLTEDDISSLALDSDEFELGLAGATPDLQHIVLSTCAALVPAATEVPGSGGECDPDKQNLYEKSGAELRLINVSPGAELAAQSRAISSDGSRVYWTDGTNLHLRDGAIDKPLDTTVGGGGTFETASSDGSVAYFSKAGHLYRFRASGGPVDDLVPAGNLEGVLGASEDGAYVYYLTTTGLHLEHEGANTPIVSSADEASFPATTGTARVSADGRHLAFVSSATDAAQYDNRNIKTGEPEPEVYLFTALDGTNPGLVCASCNPSGERPIGAASLPGASPNGVGPLAPHSYKPRVLTADSKRLFFETFDALSAQDTNNDRDVYEWEAQGVGSCTRPAGCVGLLSNGRGVSARFVDASGDGSDAYFLTATSLVPSDPGVSDIYDARVGGGLPEPETGIPCFGDACQPLPPEPEDPTPGTLRLKKSGNLPPPAQKKPLKCKKSQVKRFGKCKNKKKPQRKHRRHR